MAKDGTAAMTPVAAVARHLEWLEFALAAARDEETRRRERLGKATDKNREKRTVRLAEVTAEVRELAALVQGLRALRAPAPARRRTTRTATKSTTKPTPRRRAKPKATAAAIAKSATSPAPTASPAAPKVTPTAMPRATTAKPRATTAKPRATAAKPRTRRRTTRPPTPPA
jgi:hypothetical protein